jgi:hypothetical protein
VASSCWWKPAKDSSEWNWVVAATIISWSYVSLRCSDIHRTIVKNRGKVVQRSALGSQQILSSSALACAKLVRDKATTCNKDLACAACGLANWHYTTDDSIWQQNTSVSA